MLKLALLVLFTFICFSTQQSDIRFPDPNPTQDNPDFYESCVESIAGSTGNLFCKCKPSPTMRYFGSKLQVSPICLPSVATPSSGGGGILGNIPGRIHWSYRSENTATGAPLEIEAAVISSSRVVISWAEDQGGLETWSNSSVRIHVTELDITSNPPTVLRDKVLWGCTLNGGIVYNQNNQNIVTLCPKYCATCPNGVYDMRLIELSYSTFEVVQDYSAMLAECKVGKQYCFGATGAAFRGLKFDPVGNRYAVSHNSVWGTHSADSVVVVDAITRNVLTGATQNIMSTSETAPPTSFGYKWSCSGGHTAIVKMTYNSKVPGGFALVCTTDIASVGLLYQSVVPHRQIEVKIAPNRISDPQASITWPGSIHSCGDHIYVSWHGVQVDGLATKVGIDPDVGDADIDIGFARINAATGVIEKITWITNKNGKRDKSAKIASLSPTCDRFLFGWAESDAAQAELYPIDYYTVEVDRDGNLLTTPNKVNEYSIWYEDTEWYSIPGGSVAWFTAWRRLKTTGAPRHMPLEFDGWMNTNSNKRATYALHGYGFIGGLDGGVSPYPSRYFKTNEMHMVMYKPTGLTAGAEFVPTAPPATPSNYCRIHGDPRYWYIRVIHMYKTWNCVNNVWVGIGTITGFGQNKCRLEPPSVPTPQFYAPWMNHVVNGVLKRCGNGGYSYHWAPDPTTTAPLTATVLETNDDTLNYED